jgi:hypothetical protein
MQCSDCLTTPPPSGAFIRDRWLINPAEMLERASRRVFRLKDSACLAPLFTIERQQLEDRREIIENNAGSEKNYLHTGGNVATDQASALSQTNQITDI